MKTPQRTGASFNRSASRQDYQTPKDFRQAVINEFGYPTCDLAASKENRFGKDFISEDTNSLECDWYKLAGLLWLNPPFASIGSWAAKCNREAQRGAKILFLTPASVGSNWFANHVFGHAKVVFLNGRLTFEGAKDPYPKDCILSCYNFGTGFSVWRWK